MYFLPEQFETFSLANFPLGNEICRVLAASINHTDAGDAVTRSVHRDHDLLIINNSTYDLSSFMRISVIGVGKAVIPMAEALSKLLGGNVSNGLIITPEGPPLVAERNLSKEITMITASHPVPDQRNIDAGLRLSSFASRFNQADLVIFLLSGGGSALLVQPQQSLSLNDLQKTTSLLLKCGASITEINTVRKHLDIFKGGGLASLLYPASIITIIVSDVIGDALDVIASGPTAPDPTTYKDAWNVLSKYQLLDSIPPQVITHISSGIDGNVPDTCKDGDLIFSKVSNFIIMNNRDAIDAAKHEAGASGFQANILTSCLCGEASLVGSQLATEVIRQVHDPQHHKKPACFIAGGETTVSIHGSGLGGRNQELVLGATSVIAGSEPLLIVSLATDGVDGPTDAAGAVATNLTIARASELGLRIDQYLPRNDSYHYFAALGDLIKIGPTQTNVNDLVMIFTP